MNAFILIWENKTIYQSFKIQIVLLKKTLNFNLFWEKKSLTIFQNSNCFT